MCAYKRMHSKDRTRKTLRLKFIINFSFKCDIFHLTQVPRNRLQNEPPLSFYGVYDGHAGKDAAAFAASHLHGHILESPYFPSDPVLAIKHAFNKTDQVFLEKGQREVSKYLVYSIPYTSSVYTVMYIANTYF